MLTPNERRLYEDGFVRFANEHGYIKASQREICKEITMAFKTFIAARDRLVSLGLLVRYEYAYQGKRDHYKLVDLAEARKTKKRTERERDRVGAARLAEQTLELPLG